MQKTSSAFTIVSIKIKTPEALVSDVLIFYMVNGSFLAVYAPATLVGVVTTMPLCIEVL